MTPPRDPIYAGHRYPAEIINYAVWLYFRFPLSLRMVEEMLTACGIVVSHEGTVNLSAWREQPASNRGKLRRFML